MPVVNPLFVYGAYQISEINEASHLHDLKLLRDLNLLKNPVQVRPHQYSTSNRVCCHHFIFSLLPFAFLQEKDDHRLAVIFLLQHLTLLDQQTVTAEEKVVLNHLTIIDQIKMLSWNVIENNACLFDSILMAVFENHIDVVFPV